MLSFFCAARPFYRIICILKRGTTYPDPPAAEFAEDAGGERADDLL
jgi:hypothetical protein